MTIPTPPDQAQRQVAISERTRNVVIDAGAGTGKTTILVERLVEMLAPRGAARPIPIERIAAITFTRKAAGELRLRIREQLLRELTTAPDSLREGALREALAGLDTAYVGTIHSFADRLLRLRPVEAQLSPSYDVVEDETELTHETVAVLMQAVEDGTLAAELLGSPAASRAEEATQTILDALAAGVEPSSKEQEWGTRYGLDALVAGFIGSRDAPPPDAPPADLDLQPFRVAAAEFCALARSVSSGAYGAVWVTRMAAILRRLRRVEDPVRVHRELRRQLDRAPARNARKKDEFGNDEAAWKAWKAWIGGDRDRAGALKDELMAPLQRWLATRLVRLFPVAVELYERVKARHRQLDQLDLLVKLRDLLRDSRDLRAGFQAMFDHILVDEFQDTDPLQAEIVLFLCEGEPRAAGWAEAIPAPGRLTIVGDPKQSIYRFRRADVAMYDRVRAIIMGSGALEVELSANFRSVPPLIAWFNNRFDRILGRDPVRRFDPLDGRVFNQPLTPWREGGAAPAVQVLPFDFGDGGKHKVDEYRALEGRVMARYLGWLVERSGVQIPDPLDQRRRPVRFGDIAILAISTWQLSKLFPLLDAADVPYASRGGTLFLADPLHRQFLLGLRAVADRDDGVAEAALLRAPFFAVDLADLAIEAGKAAEPPERLKEAREFLGDLRRRRHERSPGATARDLLELTGFARAVALGPNGAQRLTRLRELCLVFEQLAAAEGLDYDAASARLREWVDAPVQLDPPHPVASEAVQILTVHQAKGLEFPVVVIWDGRGQWDARLQNAAWRMERDGRGWMIDLPTLQWEEPSGLDLRTTERRYIDTERQRVVYVAATRARDLLVIPRSGVVGDDKFVCGSLLAEAPAGLVRQLAQYLPTAAPGWAREVPPAPAQVRDAAELGDDVARRWTAASADAARPRFKPASVSETVHPEEPAEDELAPEPARRKHRAGRYGALFGTTVHRAIGLVLADPALSAADAVRRAAAITGLAERLAEASEDVDRALAALRREGLCRQPGADLQLEYAMAGSWDEGLLLTGYADLVGLAGDRLDVVDFKTDAPSTEPFEVAFGKYVAQVRAYSRLLEQAGVTAATRRYGLLFTADGSIHWTTE